MDRTLDPLRAFIRGYRRQEAAEHEARLARFGPDTTSGRSLTPRNIIAATITCVGFAAWQLDKPLGCGIALLVALLCMQEAPYRMRRANTMLCYWISLGAFAVYPVVSVAFAIQESLSRAQGEVIAYVLDRFHAERHAFPARLAELVPSHLASIPPTAIGLFTRSEYGYASAPDGSNYELWFYLHHSRSDLWVRDATGSWRRSVAGLLRSQQRR